MSNFPNRPESPDFWKLSEVVLSLDAAAEGEVSVSQLAEEYIDVETLTYMALNRTGTGLTEAIARGLLSNPQSLHVFSAAIWTDAFVAGARYQKLHPKESS